MNLSAPMQLIVVDFASAVLPPVLHAQIDDLSRRRVIRLLDSVVAMKSRDGDLIVLDTLDAPRGDPVWDGLLAKALFGVSAPETSAGVQFDLGSNIQRPSTQFGVTEDQLLEIADLIPMHSRALILLIEHIWSTELDRTAEEAEGHMLANCLIEPSFLAQMLNRGAPIFG